MNSETVTKVVRRSDAGHSPAAIAHALTLPIGKVYATLRKERPNRTRAARRGTSEVRQKVVALAAAGLKVGRVAELLGVSRAYCYRILSEAGPHSNGDHRG